jgi:hypothetical protein
MHACVHFVERIRVKDKVDPLAGADAEMVIAFRADIVIALDLLGVDDLAAILAFGPDPLRHLYLLLFHRRDGRFLLFKPSHGFILMKGRESAAKRLP